MAPKLRTFLMLALVGLLAMMALGAFDMASAHPEDDFCEGGGGFDQALCRQLSELNSSEASLTHPLLDAEGNVRSGWSSALYFMNIGVQHILPGGTDHILFVLALFLVAPNLRSLVIQISIFTVAHTATLGLTAAGLIDVPARVVEPLIALSIAFVAVENLWKFDLSRWRPLVIFGFGLFHGMGFAGYIREIGLPPEQFWPSLIGFNVGVEIGQLTVVLAAVLLSIPLKHLLPTYGLSYQKVVVVPISVVIAAIGLWWAISRSLGF